MLDTLRARAFARIADACVSISIARKMRWAEQYAAEVMLTAASIWAAHVLSRPPSNFATFPHSFAFVETLQGHESAWATIAAIGAILKVVGLLILLSRPITGRGDVLSYILRCFGLIISGFFWGLMGLSALWGNPDSLFGIWGILAALTAWWILIRFPIVPGEP